MAGCEFQLGLTAATRISIRNRGIPDPDSWTYSPYATVRTRGDGSLGGFGFATFTWNWETLSQFELGAILGLFSATAASVDVHVQTYADTGRGPQDLVVGVAVADRPTDQDGKAMISETRLPSYNSVSLRFRHFVEN
jgi:hypothetical protein